MCGNCGEPRPTTAGAVASASGQADQEDVAQPIRATIEPGFAGTVSIRFMPGRDPFQIPTRPECAPRGDRPPRMPPIAISPSAVAKLTDANRKVINWLSEDAANAALFVEDPVGALARAGVELTRAEAKSVSRSHAAVKEDAVLPPGAQISTLEALATTKGKVGSARPDPTTDTTTKTSGGTAGSC